MKAPAKIYRPLMALTLCILSSSPVVAETNVSNTCPDNFQALPLYPQARLCHVFSDTLPATISYHANATLAQVSDFYLQQLGANTQTSTQKGRKVLVSGDLSKTVIISSDGAGTQVDILVKGTN